VQPDAVIVKDLNEDVGTYCERYAGVIEIASVDDDGSSTAFRLKGAECGEKIFDRAVAF